MVDKDLLEVFAEMSGKQDHHSELIGVTNTRLIETNDILKEVMGVSIKQWDKQQKFNERLYDKVDRIEKQIVKFADFEDRVKRIENVIFKTP